MHAWDAWMLITNHTCIVHYCEHARTWHNLTVKATTPATTATMAVNATASVLQQDAAFHSNLFATGGGGGGGGISGGARPQLSPLIPGVSVPWSHTWYLVFALLLNGIFHELGTVALHTCTVQLIHAAWVVATMCTQAARCFWLRS